MVVWLISNIFTLTFANFAFVTESLAISLTETLFAKNSDTGPKNVKFEAYFGTEEDKSASVISDVNNEELSIGMKLNVRENGYLKDARLLIEAENGLSFNEILEKSFKNFVIQKI